MASNLVMALSIDSAKIWSGGHRAVYAPLGTPMPADLSGIISVTTFQLVAPWVDLGATSEDGFTITREGDISEGVSIDQRDTNLFGGSYTGVTMGGSCTMMYTDPASLSLKWEFGAPVTAGKITTVAMGSPPQPQPRMMAILQQNRDGQLRGFVFRRATPELTGDLTVNKQDPEGTEVSFIFQPDASIGDGSEFGKLFYHDLRVTPTSISKASTPYTFLPQGSYVPSNLSALQALGALGESTAWTSTNYIVLGDSSLAHWTGTVWAAGAKP
jgi:hypothetical protein